MRLGGPIFEKFDSPDGWIAAVKRAGYGAANCPVNADADDETVRAYAAAAARAGILIAEVGAWSNPLSRDAAVAAEAFEKCCRQLALADRIGARCCVNIAGSRGEKWDGPCPDDLTDETFDAIVESVRAIIDRVGPTRTFYTLETMPWMYPDSADSYVRLVEAIGRERFAVHFDPVNLINCPARSFDTAAVIREFVAKLGPRIRSCHAKDTLLGGKLTVHLDEAPPGKGTLDYAAFLAEVERLDADMPVMMEHMKQADYGPAGAFIRQAAERAGVALR